MSKEPVKSNNEHVSARQRAQTLTVEEREEIDRRQRTEPDYLEKTKPEDPSARPGQLTRDNVNPNIPSGPKERPLLPDGRVDPNAGGIVDPTSLGMPQGGKEPNYPPLPDELRKQQQEDAKRQQAAAADPQLTKEGEIQGSQYSINEPPGSDVYEHVPGMDNELPPEGGAREALPKSEQGQPKVARGPEASDDPDEIEDELDQMEEEGEVEKRGKSPKKK